MSELLKNQKTIEEVAQLIVLDTTYQNSVRVTPPSGFIGNIVAHFDTPPNAGFVQGYLKDAAGLDIAKLQPLSALRSRNVPFELDGKPINIESNGRTFEFGVIATQPFTADFQIALLFVFKPTENCNI